MTTRKKCLSAASDARKGAKQDETRMPVGKPAKTLLASRGSCTDAGRLRQLAEAKVAQSREVDEALTLGETSRMLHEMQVHQIELEMQGEELHRAKKELEESRARYYDLYDLAPVGYVTVSGPGLILESNLTAAALLDVNRSTLVRQPFSRFILEQDADNYHLFRTQVMKTSEPLACDLRMMRGGGTPFWAHLVASAAKDGDGAPVCRIVLSDSTGRMQAEEALRKADSSLRAITSHTPDHILIQDRNLRYTMIINPQLGLTEAGMLGKTDRDLLAKEDVERITHIKRTVLATGESVRLVTSLQNVKGETEFFEGAYVPTFGADGKTDGLVGYFRNVTANVRAEEALRKSEQQYRSLFNSMTEGFALHELLFDEQGQPCDYRFLAVNPAFERLTGLKAENLVGKSQRQVLPEEDRFWLETYSKVALTGEPTHIEHASTILQRHFTVFAYCPAPNQFATIFSDISEQKQAEAFRDISLEILRVLNEPGDLLDSMRRVITVLKDKTGTDAVGLRLQDGDDFPYFAQQGFPEDFLLTENTLVEHAADGEACRDGDGHISLTCTCGLVISGKTDPTHPLFTRRGSFCTNDSFPLLDLPPGQDPRRLPRNHCIHRGYASMALVPIRDMTRIVGLLHLNDRRKGCFNLATVHFLEDLASHIGAALMRKRIETALKESESRFAQLAAQSRTLAWEVNAQGLFTYVSHVAETVTGYRPEELVGEMHFYDLHPEIGREAFKQAALAAFERKEPFRNRVNAVQRKDGCTVWVTTNGDPLLNADGTLRGYRGSDADITERTLANEQLRKSNEQFRTLAEVAPAGIYLCDPTGDCLYANPSWCDMAGLSSQEALGEGWAAGLHPEDRERVFTGWRQMVEAQSQWGLEYRFQTREGKVTWVYGMASPQHDASGKIVQYVGINLDITEHKRADEVQTFLAQTGSGPGDEPFFNALARYLAQSLGMDFVCIDRLEGDGLTAQTVAVWCDGRFEDNVTYALKDTPCGDVVGKQVCCFPSSVCQFFPRDQVLKDLRAESYIGVTLFGHTGNPVGLIAVIGHSPLTNRPLAEAVLKQVAVRAAGEIERLEVEATLRESEAYTRAILDSLPIGIAVNSVVDEVKFSYMNENFLRFYRTTHKKLTDADSFWSAVYEEPDFREKLKKRVLADCASGDPKRMRWVDIPITRKGAETRYISAMNTPMPGRQLMISAVWDVTERKRAEAELLKLQNLQSVGTLAGGIAHDFNNILLGVFGNISLALEDFPDAHPSSAFLREAERSMSRAMRLTKQLLTFSKGGTPVKESVGLSTLVDDVARFDLSGSNVSLDCRQDGNLWPVDADKGQIQQVISNLVINARQSMPNGGHLHITMENTELPEGAVDSLRQGRYVKVSVRDEGTGIEQALLNRIFDPYFTTKQTGSGLGLATVWSIITKHDGHIGVVSELGNGTTFTFYLPASESAQPADSAPPPTGEITPRAPARAANILVMDDEESVCKLVARMLKRGGYSVTTALDSQRTMALYRQALESGEPFDLVIMDMTIPGGLGGKETVKALLALDPHVRAIVSSGYAEDPVMSNPAAYGFKDAAAKPYTPSELREVVARVLK